MDPLQLQNLEKRAVYDGLRVQLTPAPFFRRFLAYCVDLGILYSVVSFIIFFLIIFLVAFGVIAAGVIASLRGEHGNAAAVIAVTVIFAAILVVLSIQDIYFIYFERKQGTTFGKKLFGLRVVSTDGSSVTFGQAFIRDFMRYFDCFLVVPALLSVSISKQNRRLGDLLAGTIVVYSEARERGLQSIYLRHEDFEALLARVQTAVIPSDVRRRYLSIAFPAFITKALPPQALEEWTPWVNGQCSGIDLPEIAQEMRNRFLAELCFQQEQKGV